MADTSIVPYSDDSRQPSIFEFNGKKFYALTDDHGDPWFIGNDVCEVLDIANPRQALARLDDDEKGVSQIDTPGGKQKVIVINESGLYNLIIRSDKPIAKAFKRWITHEVLPSLRKTGSYSLQSVSPLQQLKAIVAHMEQTERQLAELDQKQAEQAMQIEAITDRLNDSDYYTVRQFCIKQRIEFTQSLLIKWGKESTALSRHRGIERKEAIENDRPTGRYHKSVLFDVCLPKRSNNNQPYLLPKGE